MFKNLFSKPIEAAKDKVSEYVKLRLEETKLTAIEKSSPIAASAVLGAVVLAIALILLVFLGMGVAEFFAKVFDSVALGYFATSGIFLIVLVILVAFFKKFVRLIANIIAKNLTDFL